MKKININRFALYNCETNKMLPITFETEKEALDFKTKIFENVVSGQMLLEDYYNIQIVNIQA